MIPKYAKKLFESTYEKPCGCEYRSFSERTALEIPDTIKVDSEFVEVYRKEYRNATVTKDDWHVTVRCLECGGEWTDVRKGSTCTDYGAENPDAPTKLVVRETAPRHFVHKDEPVVE